MTADALATAFMVLSVEESLAIANEHQIPIMIIEDKFGKLITHHSESFKKYIKAVGTGPKGNRELEEDEIIDAIKLILNRYLIKLE